VFFETRCILVRSWETHNRFVFAERRTCGVW